MKTVCSHFPVAGGFFEYQDTSTSRASSSGANEREQELDEVLSRVQATTSGKANKIVPSKTPGPDLGKQYAPVSSWVIVQCEEMKKIIHFCWTDTVD